MNLAGMLYGTQLLQAAEKRCRPWFDRLTMRFKPLKSLDLILSLSKDEAEISGFFSSLLGPGTVRAPSPKRHSRARPLPPSFSGAWLAAQLKQFD